TLDTLANTSLFFFFFFQAEDGIRDRTVTGVQTCALPIFNVEQLRFPSGIAAAETLHALYSHGAKGLRAAKALGAAGLLAGLDKQIGRASCRERVETAGRGGGEKRKEEKKR